jgi:hypothetical protein
LQRRNRETHRSPVVDNGKRGFPLGAGSTIGLEDVMENDGGPAFPLVAEYGPKLDSSAGMSLRDYFAIHAPEPDQEMIRTEQSIDRMANPHNDSYKPQLRDSLTIKAQLRFRYADAMLAEREK